MGCIQNVAIAARSVASRVASAIKAVLAIPLTIKGRGGWPWYLFLVAHVFILAPLPFKLYYAVRPAHVFGMFKTDLDLAHVPNYETDGGALKPLAAADKRRVRDTMNRYSAYCQTLDGPRAEFCEHMQNRELLSAYNDFRKGRAKHCEGKWNEERNFELFYTNTDEAGYHDLDPDPSSPLYDVTFQVFAATVRGPYEEDEALGDHAKAPPSDFLTTDHDYVKSTCEFDSASSGGRWYVSRVGPFTDRTKGSWQWLWYHAFKDVDAFALPGSIGRYMTATFNSLTDARGNTLGNPPVHMHHFHTWKVNPFSPIWPGIDFQGFESHGDDMCEHAGLGPICYMKTWPPGYGLAVPPRLFVDALVNFEADPDLGEPQEFYYESVVHVQDDGEIHQVIPFVPRVHEVMSQVPQQAAAYPVPAGKESMSWGVIPAEFDLEVLWWKLHTHYLYTSDIWFLDGDGTEMMGLGAKPFVLEEKPLTKDMWPTRGDSPTAAAEFEDAVEYIKYDYPIPGAVAPYWYRLLELKAGLDMVSVKAQLLANLAKWNDDRAPADRKGFILKVDGVLDFHHEIDGTPKRWTTRPKTTLSKTTFKAGEKVTIVIFHKPIPELIAAGESGLTDFPMHMIFSCETKPLDPVVNFMSSTRGMKLAYVLKYEPALVVVPVLLVLVGLLAKAASLYRAGKCRTKGWWWFDVNKIAHGDYDRVALKDDP
jgi:hypothetical protein